MTMARSILLGIRNISDEFVNKSKTQILCSINFYSENRAFYEIMWKNMVEPHTSQIKIWRMHIACRITKAINVHSEHIILTGFPRHQWLHERASMLPVFFSLIRRYMNVSKLNFMLL
jgi:hypothetical protein